jgi:Transcriptional regulator, AbiEi antitoxin, Type IV TA system/Transcriptional regulator, AbiEi antitoxin N-terminal domain
MLNMVERNKDKLNRLQALLPGDLLATTAWLGKHGYPTNLLTHYAKRGWLESPARGVYRKPGPPLKWQHAVLSLTRMLEGSVHVGGLTALELRGYAHFLKPRGLRQVELYLDAKAPGWLTKLPFAERFVVHRNTLFAFPPTRQESKGVAAEPWGGWDDPLPVALPERAMLEFLDEVPARQSLEHAALLMQGLHDLNSRRVLQLLGACRSFKVKRLFLALTARQQFQWVKPVLQAADRGEVSLGRGKRSLAKGGKFDSKYRITVPDDPDVRG